jgi:alpha-L-rhamnosidase
VWQFANLMPLALNITPPALAGPVLAALVRSIKDGAGGGPTGCSGLCIATGFWGTRFMLETLTRLGEHDLALTLATKTDYPSWGFMVTPNASNPHVVGTIWESWAGDDSLDHPALGGGVGAWLYAAAGRRRRGPCCHVASRESAPLSFLW